MLFADLRQAGPQAHRPAACAWPADQDTGYPFVGPSTIKPRGKLAKHLPLGRLDWCALRLADDPQLVILNPGADTYYDDGDAEIVLRKESSETQSWLKGVTAEMQTINDAIRAA